MTELIKYKREDLKAIGEVARMCSPTALAQMEEFEQSLTLAAAMRKLDAMITSEMMDDVMLLMNSPLGFVTDKSGANDTPYGKEIVKRCFIEATLRGARSVGNEWNIISSKAYLTRAYFERALKDLPDLKNLKIVPGIPVMRDGGAIVRMDATWTYKGHLGELKRDFPVKVNNGMGVDAILGKADRKFRAAIMRQLTGTDWGEDEEDAPVASLNSVIETTAEKVETSPGTTTKTPDHDPSETPLDSILRQIGEAPNQDALKRLFDEAATASQKGELDSKDWPKVVAARRKRASALGAKA